MVSTTGQGEQPSNAKVFWKKLLRRKLGPGTLQSLRFAIFGLGDSSYPQYNWAALKLRKRLVQLGASEVFEAGKGDEQHPEGHDGTFVPWSQGLRAELARRYPLDDGIEALPDDVLLEPQWLLSTSVETKGDAMLQTSEPLTFAQPQDVEFIKVVLEENNRVTPRDHWQDVRLLKLSTPEYIQYSPGDVLVIHPENPPEDVEQIIELMGWHDVADLPLTFRPNPRSPSSAFRLPRPSFDGPAEARLTLRALLARHLDLNAVPRRSFFHLLPHFAADDVQRVRLVEFAQPEYLDELYDYTTRPRRSVLEVLQEFDSVKIPHAWAAAVLPALHGRQFSIASGGELKRGPAGGTALELLVAIVAYRTVIRKTRRGVCTRYLAALPAGAELRVSLERRGMTFDTARTRMPPLILVGPGTGIAPIRSLIWERRALRSESARLTAGDPPAGPAEAEEAPTEEVLFFGCRNENADFFFRDEWPTLPGPSGLHVFPAFSRDQKQKVYVQDVIRSQSSRVWRLLENDAIVYVCGSSGKMPQAVREALIEVCETEGQLSREMAEKRIQAMDRNNLYKQVGACTLLFICFASNSTQETW